MTAGEKRLFARVALALMSLVGVVFGGLGLAIVCGWLGADPAADDPWWLGACLLGLAIPCGYGAVYWGQVLAGRRAVRWSWGGRVSRVDVDDPA